MYILDRLRSVSVSPRWVLCELRAYTRNRFYNQERERDERKYAGGYAVDTIIIIDSFNFQFVK